MGVEVTLLDMIGKVPSTVTAGTRLGDGGLPKALPLKALPLKA